MRNCVDGTFCMDGGSILLGSFQREITKNKYSYASVEIDLTLGRQFPTLKMRHRDVGVVI